MAEGLADDVGERTQDRLLRVEKTTPAIGSR
jgi:hypothetical protein